MRPQLIKRISDVEGVAIDARRKVLAEVLQEAINYIDVTPIQYPPVMAKAMPIVIILNGIATTGKDTFIELMNKYWEHDFKIAHISAIDPVRNAAKALLDAVDQYEDHLVNHMSAQDVIVTKDDHYRQLLFKVKAAWEEHDFGATAYSAGKIAHLIELSNDTDPDTFGCGAIVIDVRETEMIDRLADTLRDAGVIALKMLITSDRVKKEDWTNGAETGVCLDSSYYDLVVRNDDLDELEKIAEAFSKRLSQALRCYGVPVPITN